MQRWLVEQPSSKVNVMKFFKKPAVLFLLLLIAMIIDHTFLS